MNHSKLFLLCVGVVMLVLATEAAPQGSQDEKPMPYEYKYEVKDPEKELFHNKQESGDESGKVTGSFSVLLADGRLMTVEYSVDGDSGFVPKISFQDNAKPF